MKVYCAGPLFNEKEKQEMAEIAAALEAKGFDVFLPQRDGLELSKCIESLVESGVDRQTACDCLSKAIFALDVYQVVEECDAIIVNLNGRVPDEGAVAEAALAWYAGKTMLAYKADVRTAFNGYDNPLVMGLFGFRVCESIRQLADELHETTAKGFHELRPVERKAEIESLLSFGKRIWHALQSSDGGDGVVHVLLQQAESQA